MPRVSERAAGTARSHAAIYAVVRRIPRGRVATYGQVAREARLPGHARLVGYALAQGGPPGLPWHRVLNARGTVSVRSEPGGEDVQRARLEGEGVVFSASGRVDLARHGWRPRTRT